MNSKIRQMIESKKKKKRDNLIVSLTGSIAHLNSKVLTDVLASKGVKLKCKYLAKG
jgi:hypothetical protein